MLKTPLTFQEMELFYIFSKKPFLIFWKMELFKKYFIFQHVICQAQNV